MDPMSKLAQAMKEAVSGGVDSQLVAFVVTTSHRGRLETMFKNAAGDLLSVHQQLQQHDSRSGRIHRQRLKRLVDLVRARLAMLNSRRPTFKKLWDEGVRRTMPLRNVSLHHKAA